MATTETLAVRNRFAMRLPRTRLPGGAGHQSPAWGFPVLRCDPPFDYFLEAPDNDIGGDLDADQRTAWRVGKRLQSRVAFQTECPPFVRSVAGYFFSQPLSGYRHGFLEIAAEVLPIVDHDGDARVCHQILVFQAAPFRHQDEGLQILGHGEGHQAGIGLPVIVGGQDSVFLRFKQAGQKRLN